MRNELVPEGDAGLVRRNEEGAVRGEVAGVARDLATGYAKLVDNHRRAWAISHAESDQRIRADPAEVVARVAEAPADQVSWWKLAELTERDPEAAAGLWQRIRAEAAAELASGYRAARAVGHDRGPLERAEFLALRDAFRAEWRPRGGLEGALLDAAVQAFTGYLVWLARLDVQATSEGRVEDHQLEERGYYRTPRLTTAQAMEQSAAMADRFHKMFVRSLRALRDLRRGSGPALAIAQAGQVNLSSGPQLNIGTAPDRSHRASGSSTEGGAP